MPVVVPVNFGVAGARFDLIGTTTFGFCVTGHSFGVGVPSAGDGANAVFDSYEGGGISNVLTEDWRLAQVDMMIMTPGGPVVGSSTRTPVQGGIGNQGTEANTAALVRKNTAQGGRPGRGRMYIPGISEDFVDVAGFLSAAYFNDIQVFATDFLNTLGVNDVPMELLHSSAAISPSLVTSLSCQNQVATQRRRLRR